MPHASLEQQEVPESANKKTTIQNYAVHQRKQRAINKRKKQSKNATEFLFVWKYKKSQKFYPTMQRLSMERILNTANHRQTDNPKER